ncbi:MAG TPA: hypothetical protein VGY48_31540 [Vicinamibacterales bacterium]|nr:hypothetical protein [Vicinamibacterales bacterium]
MDLRQLMNPKLIALAVAVVLAVVLLAWLFVQRRRSTTTLVMRQRFGPEYERAVGEHGSARRAEAHLAAREKRVEKLKIHDLDPAKREQFSAQWQVLQSRFVDDPKGAVTEADALVSTLMQARGYPVADFTQRAADISVDHPRVVANYRSAHEIALRLGNGEANTEDLRTAMIHYRSLFEELVQVSPAVEIKEVA